MQETLSYINFGQKNEFSGYYFTGRNFAFLIIFGESKSPRKRLTCRFAKVYPTWNGPTSRFAKSWRKKNQISCFSRIFDEERCAFVFFFL